MCDFDVSKLKWGSKKKTFCWSGGWSTAGWSLMASCKGNRPRWRKGLRRRSGPRVRQRGMRWRSASSLVWGVKKSNSVYSSKSAKREHVIARHCPSKISSTSSTTSIFSSCSVARRRGPIEIKWLKKNWTTLAFNAIFLNRVEYLGFLKNSFLLYLMGCWKI